MRSFRNVQWLALSISLLQQVKQAVVQASEAALYSALGAIVIALGVIICLIKIFVRKGGRGSQGAAMPEDTVNMATTRVTSTSSRAVVPHILNERAAATARALERLVHHQNLRSILQRK